jgi:LCP family protein required for cell wall assembly
MTIDINLKDNQETTQPLPQQQPKDVVQEVKTKRKRKERKPKDKKKRKKTFLIVAIILLSLAVGASAYYVYKGYKLSKDIGLKLTAQDLIPTKEDPELKKDPSGKYTNVLVVGIDTREGGNLMNTDSIILISYDYETKEVTMLSIPRDFHVEINDSNWYARINSVYSSAEKLEEGTGLEELKETVEEITNQQIQYHALVDYNAFVEIIDAVGGVTVNVENTFTDYMYPLGIGYQTVSFQAGPQEMDGETALKYARSRHSMDNNEGTDYARAARQQNVIKALQEKIISTETFTNPKTLMSIFSSVAENLKVSEFTLEDIEAGLDLAKTFNEENKEVYSFVLDPSAGNNQIIERKIMESGAYAIGPVLGFGQYDDIQAFLSLLYASPAIYKEDARILVYNTGLGHQESYQKTLELREEYPYLDITFSGTLYSDKEGTLVYTQNEEEPKTETVKILSKYLETTEIEQPEYITTHLNGEDVTILLGSQIEEETETSEI